MTPEEQAAQETADAVRQAEEVRRQAEADLQRHGQAVVAVSSLSQ